MRDDKIRNALLKIAPDEALRRRVDAMVDAADLTPREPAVRRVKRPAKAMLIAAAIVVMMAMAVSAVGVFARLFYLPGAGLVDESGVLVIKEDDIGDLDVTAYRTADELELGGYVIESVTYTEYEGLRSYTVWSHMGDARMAELGRQADDSVITVADHVISDLTLTLPDGTILTVTHDRYFLDTTCTKMIEVKDGHVRMFTGTYSEMKGRPNVREVVMDADEYRVLSAFTNWVTGRKYAKGDRVLITPAEQKSFEWALEQGKLKKTGGRQRKKVNVSKDEKKP